MAKVEPSGWLALELDAGSTDPEVLDDAELIDAIVAFDHVGSWAGARQARLLAEFARRRPGDDPAAVGCDTPGATSRWAPDEIGLALGQSRLSAKNRIVQATRLDEVLPDTLAAWEAGRLDAAKVRAICDATSFLSPGHARAVQHRVLPRAGQHSLAQLRAALARAVTAIDPDGAAARHRQARRSRRVALGADTDGMASLWALLPAPDATSAYHWLSRLARGLGRHDPRSMDARRADLLVQLLTGQLTLTPTPHGDAAAPRSDHGAPLGVDPDGATGPDPDTHADAPGHDATDSADQNSDSDTGCAAPRQRRPPGTRAPAPPGKPLIHIVMPYSTLIGADDHPAELAGYGPIPADLAREIAADAVWKRLITDPLSGALLDHGRHTYRPPQALADHVRARDLECRFPTCRRRTLDTELDHITAWAEGGTTSDTNLAGGCPHHHHLKHDAGWTVTLHTDARMTWTTPTGHSYTSQPHDYRPEPDIPPHAAARPVAARDLPAPPGPGLADLLDGSTPPPAPDDEQPPF